MAHTDHGARGNRLLTLVTAALAIAGVVELGHANAAAGPPRPATAVIGKLPPVATKPAAVPTPTMTMPYSVPAHVDVPAVNLHADVISVGLNADESIGTPSLSNAKVAAWYDRGPAPGQLGAAVMDAHVDSAQMSDYRGAFFELGLAKPGMEIDVTRVDHSVAVFTIDEVQVALKADFPSNKVYAPTAYAGLRLITCGGDYDKKTHEYLGNTIAYAHLTAVRAAPLPGPA